MNKIPMEGVTETKFGAEMEGKTIQRLPHPGIHPIYNHQTQTLLHIPERVCWQDPDIAFLWDYAKAWQIQKWMLTVIYWMEHRAPNEGARESTQDAEGVCSPQGGTAIWTNLYSPELVSLVAYVAEDGLVSHQWEERPLVLWRLYAPV